MLTCLPKSICDRNYRIRGLPEAEVEVLFDALSEQGTIRFGAQSFRVRKHGAASGRWTLESEGEVLAEAKKPSAMRRRFEIQTLGTTFELEAESAFGRAFVLSHDGEPCGRIRPMHAWTRRAVIECDASIDAMTQLFSFWLVALMWRRAEQAAAS